MNNTLTAIPGIRVGHVTDREGCTGCTVVLCPPDTVAGFDQRGGGPGTRETDLLRPTGHVNSVNAILLSGGSAFGLSAAGGVMRWLEERGRGYRTGDGSIVPIVPAAILYDLGLGVRGIRPGEEAGYLACSRASSKPVAEGSVGAGTGCRVCSMAGNSRASKGGTGSGLLSVGGGLQVAALMAVNALGEILDEEGRILAGLRSTRNPGEFVPVLEELDKHLTARQSRKNTVIGVVATNARLTKSDVTRVARMASNGVARVVRPAHTAHDGDTMFVLATGRLEADASVIGAFAAEAVAIAIRRAVRAATSLGGVRAISDPG
ncbi:MAG: P1 family peptidase [Anaerolineaceae bacterium]|nr:P1 family peptidase [Anaerolineaceae bacterium]